MKLSLPPRSKNSVLTSEELQNVLRPLVGTTFIPTHRPRTDGSRIRKLISSMVQPHTTNASEGTFTIIPPRKKGVPKVLSELIDTYIVSTGDKYNLQIWNRNPIGKNPLVTYDNNDRITPQDIRLVMVKIDVTREIISSIVILTPDYIEQRFGKFGKETIKNQLLIHDKCRNSIIQSDERILFYDDTQKVKSLSVSHPDLSSIQSTDSPTRNTLMPLSEIKDIVAMNLIGVTLEAPDTKTKGQLLEKKVIQLLGLHEDSRLAGGFPDVPQQLLEVKVQDSPTVDLGRYSPQFEEIIDENLDITTRDVRYLIALTNKLSNKIEGIILSSGDSLDSVFTYISDVNYKCQRSIPMNFFDGFEGQCVINP